MKQSQLVAMIENIIENDFEPRIRKIVKEEISKAFNMSYFGKGLIVTENKSIQKKKPTGWEANDTPKLQQVTQKKTQKKEEYSPVIDLEGMKNKWMQQLRETASDMNKEEMEEDYFDENGNEVEQDNYRASGIAEVMNENSEASVFDLPENRLPDFLKKTYDGGKLI